MLAWPAANALAQVNGLEEIVVTAQRRAEQLENVPMSVVAVTPEKIEKAGGTVTLLGKAAESETPVKGKKAAKPVAKTAPVAEAEATPAESPAQEADSTESAE